MDIITKEKDWHLQIAELEIGAELPFSYTHQASIRSMISGLIKTKFPDLKFKTEKKDNILIVRRTA